MSHPPLSRVPALPRAFAFALLLCSLSVVRAASGTRPEDSYQRPPAETVRSELVDVLADPRYRPRQSLWQRLFGEEGRMDVELPPALEEALLWFAIVWCVLALVAIVGHLVWTLTLFLPHRRTGGPARRFRVGGQKLSYEELRRRVDRMAERGAFRPAVGLMMLALLRWLDDAGVIRFHESKTNGDYVREYPREAPARDAFRRFALAFDHLVYGSDRCSREAYANMRTMFEEVRDDVRGRP